MKLTSRLFAMAVAAVVFSSWAAMARADQVGVWQFNGSLNNELPGGAAMSVAGGWMTAFVNDSIGGSPASVLSFPAMTVNQALEMPNQAAPNGGSATTTNIWTIVMDVKFPSAGNYTSLWQTGAFNSGDGDYFVRDTEGIGISGQYAGTYVPSDWNRLAITVDSAGGPGTNYVVNGYINGTLAGTATTSTSPDGKEAIGAILHLFNDEDGESSAGLVNSVAFYNEALSANAIGLLGGATASGIPVVPEPTTIALLSGVLAAFAFVRRR